MMFLDGVCVGGDALGNRGDTGSDGSGGDDEHINVSNKLGDEAAPDSATGPTKDTAGDSGVVAVGDVTTTPTPDGQNGCCVPSAPRCGTASARLAPSVACLSARRLRVSLGMSRLRAAVQTNGCDHDYPLPAGRGNPCFFHWPKRMDLWFSLPTRNLEAVRPPLLRLSRPLGRKKHNPFPSFRHLSNMTNGSAATTGTDLHFFRLSFFFFLLGKTDSSPV